MKIEEPLPPPQQEPELEDDPLASLEPELPGSVDNSVDELDDAIDAIQEVEPIEEFDEVSDDTNLIKSSPFLKPAMEEPAFDLVADDAENFEASGPDESYSEISNEELKIETQPESTIPNLNQLSSNLSPLSSNLNLLRSNPKLLS